MSAHNKTDRIVNKISGFSLASLIIILILILFSILLASCQKQNQTRYGIVVLEQKDNVSVPDETPAVSIIETNRTSIISIIPEQPEEPEVTQNETQITEIIEEEQGQERTTTGTNAVEFYFLLRQKAYFRYLLKENEPKEFDLYGTIVRIEPIFIANDSAVFKIDNYPTNAIREREWYSAPNFEIYVSRIYYRR